jgi:hypothetical protein
MADTQAIRFIENLFERIDKHVRAIVASMLKDPLVAAQDDGSVVSNQWNILNFQGGGVVVQEDNPQRRVNILIPGSPIGTGSQIVQSSDAGIKCLSLWTGSTNSSPPAGWTTVGFNDSAWTTPVTVSAAAPGGANLWPTSSPVNAAEEALFREAFTIAAGSQISTASLAEVQNDDLLGVWINGVSVGSDTGAGSNTFTVSPTVLVVGANVIAFHVRNAD